MTDTFPEDEIGTEKGDKPCPNCGSHDQFSGYGFAAGALGGYVICFDCGWVLEHCPDPDAGPVTGGGGVQRKSTKGMTA